MQRIGSIIFASCALAGCPEVADDAPLFGGDLADELAIDPELAATTRLDQITITAAPGPGDRDGDRILDDLDTCPEVADYSNVDTDLDGLGNACDADYDNSGSVTVTDYAILLAAFGRASGDAGYDARADHDHDGSVTAADFARFLAYYGGPAAVSATKALARADIGDVVYLRGTWTVVGAGGISGTGAMISTGTIVSVERDSAGGITRLVTTASPVTIWNPSVLVVEQLFVPSTQPASFVSCSRAVLRPDRPTTALSQLCTPFTFTSFGLAIARS